MLTRTEELIETLAAGLQPVQRLRAPGLRALVWLAVVGVVGALLIWRFANLTLALQRLQQPRIALELAGSALTAVAAILAAFQLSIPGRSRHWGWLPLPGLVIWLGASGLGCLANGMYPHATPESAVKSAHCFVFIAGSSVPLAAGLFWMLRRARTLAPVPVAAFGTLGVAASAATLLQFFHPFDITLLDLSSHAAAVALVMLIGTAMRRPLLASRT